MKREIMDHKKRNLLTRRQAIRSLAAITAGTLIKPSPVFGVESVKSVTRFAVIGDWGTGGDDQFGLGKQMYETHSRAAFILYSPRAITFTPMAAAVTSKRDSKSRLRPC